jgi:hypothetical protein
MAWYLFHSTLIVGLTFWLKKRYEQEPLSAFFIPGMMLKLMAGVGYGLLYIVYYQETGDSFNYFQDACHLTALAHHDFMGYVRLLFFNEYFPELDPFISSHVWRSERTFMMIKLVSIFNLLTGDNYWLTGFYFSFFSFWGMWQVANALSRLFPRSSYAALLALVFFPSTIFFSSGLSKESLALASIGFMLARFLGYLEPQKRSYSYHLGTSLIYLIGIVILALMRFYYLAALLACMGAFVGTVLVLAQLKKLNIQLPAYGQVLLMFGLSAFLLWIATLSSPLLHLDYFWYAVVYSHNLSYILSDYNDLIHYSTWGGNGYITLDANWKNMFINVPLAFISALFRPFIWETGGNKLKIIYSLENLAVMIFSVWTIIFFWKEKYKSTYYLKTNTLLLTALGMYLVVLLSLIALASPNLGSLARYRVGGYPFFVYVVLLPLSDWLYKKSFIRKIFPIKPFSNKC